MLSSRRDLIVCEMEGGGPEGRPPPSCRGPRGGRAGPTHPGGPPRGSRPAGAGAGPPRPAGAPREGSALPASPAGLEGLGTESQPGTSRCGNLTNHAGGFRARGEVRGPPASAGRGSGGRESGAGGRERGEGAGTARRRRAVTAGASPAPSPLAAPRAPRALGWGEGPPAPAPRACPPPAARLAHPPGAPRAARAAADLPRWHRCHKPARNCKANKAEILGLVSIVTRSALLPPICLCSSI